MSLPDSSVAKDLDTLSRHLAFKDVRYNELRAKAEDIPEEELVPPILRLHVMIADKPQDDQPDMLNAQVALNVDLTVPEGRVCVEPVALFQIPIKYSTALNARALTAYVNETGFFQILPFARQSMFDISSRVFRNPILMPIFQPGDANFELPPLEDDAEPRDND